MTQADPTTERRAPAPETWVAAHGDYLYRFALGKVRSPDVAEEMVQETLLAAWRGRAGFAGNSSERSWLTAILKRKVIDWVRRRVRDRATALPDAEPDAAAADPFDKWGHWKKPPGDWNQADPAAAMYRDEFWATLHGCLGKLPSRLHDVFVLRYLDETSGPEVCQELGLTPTNLWAMLHRARLRMSQCLTANWFQQTPGEGGKPC